MSSPTDRRARRRGPPPGLPPGTPASSGAPAITTPLPPVAATGAAVTPLPANAQLPGASRLEDIRKQRRKTAEGGRTVIREPGRVIVQDPSGQSFVRHNDIDRFRSGARDVKVQKQGNNTRTVITRANGSKIILITGPDGKLLRRICRHRGGREIIIIDNTFPIGGYYVELPPLDLTIPPDSYIIDGDYASPDMIYDTLVAPPVERIDRRFSLDQIRYSPSVRQRMRSVDLDTINFDIGSAEVSPDQAAKLQAIADGLNRAIARNPSEVFLIEGHTDAVGDEIDNLSLSDRRAESVANLLTRQLQVPAENLTSQGYGEQYQKVTSDGPERRNRRVTIRRITPLLTGQNTTVGLPPPQ